MKTNTRLKPTPHSPNCKDYVPFSRKFAIRFQEILDNDSNGVRFTNIVGVSGSGKSTTLLNEFIKPLTDHAVVFACFAFAPENRLHNYRFLYILMEELLHKVPKTAEYNPYIQELRAHKDLQESNGKVIPLTSDMPHLIIQLLDLMSSTQKVILIFEDIHWGHQNFKEFLSEVVKLRGNIDIVCTSRNMPLLFPECAAKNLVVEHLNEKSAAKLISSIGPVETEQSKFSTYYKLSKGNPLCLKELLSLAQIQKDKSTILSTEDLIALSNDNISQIVTNLRFNQLSPEHKKILTILCMMSGSADETVFYQFLSYLALETNREDLMALKNSFFVISIDGTISFPHNLIYTTVKSIISNEETIAISQALYCFYKSQRSIKDRLEKMTLSAEGAQLYKAAYCLSLKLACKLYNESQFEAAEIYFQRTKKFLTLCPVSSKTISRIKEINIYLHDCNLILGNNEKAKSIAYALETLIPELSPQDVIHVYAALSRSAWTWGQLRDAVHYSKQNLEILSTQAQQHGDKITALVRLGSIYSEMGEFTKSIHFHNEALRLIKDTERSEKFGLFAQAYPNILSVQAICYAELGQMATARDRYKEAFALFDTIRDDSFTKLFIATHAGYAAILSDDLDIARCYLEQGVELSTHIKASILGPSCLALLGSCHIYGGDIRLGRNLVEKAYTQAQKNKQKHKSGLITMIYMEAMLASFDTKQFEATIDEFLDRFKNSEQLSFLAWGYLLKTIYHSLYSVSLKGYIGTMARTNMLSQSLKMKCVSDNILNLSILDKYNFFRQDERPLNLTCLDKAKFFTDLMSSVTSLYLHRKN